MVIWSTVKCSESTHDGRIKLQMSIIRCIWVMPAAFVWKLCFRCGAIPRGMSSIPTDSGLTPVHRAPRPPRCLSPANRQASLWWRPPAAALGGAWAGQRWPKPGKGPNRLAGGSSRQQIPPTDTACEGPGAGSAPACRPGSACGSWCGSGRFAAPGSGW